jgi:hypothetical protein
LRSILLFSAALLAFWSAPAWADGVLLYGPEWTFTEPELLNLHLAPENELQQKWEARHQAVEKAVRKLNEVCQSTGLCKGRPFDGRKDPTAFFDFAPGVWFGLSSDPAVIEVTAGKLSFADWKKYLDLFQKVVFDGLKSAGYTPHEREGAGHLNIGLNYFEDKPLLRRNFPVDILNHEGVALVLNSLTANENDATPFRRWPVEKRNLFFNSLAAMDKERDYSEARFERAFKAIRAKYVPIGLRGKDDEARFEIRTLRPQPSMKEFLQTIEIYEARIHYLETLQHPIALLKRPQVSDGWAALGEFADFLKESKLDWKDYKALLPEIWRDLPEENFEHSHSLVQCIVDSLSAAGDH